MGRALLAILLHEDDEERSTACWRSGTAPVVSTVNYWEALVRAALAHGDAGHALADELLARLSIRIESADGELTRRAAVAFERSRGRGGGRLNLGDCFAYALAEREGEGLLFKGNDFPKTDVKSALP